MSRNSIYSLQNNGLIEDVGGAAYVSALLDKVPTSGNIRYFINVVREKSLKRRLINGCTAIIAKCYDGEYEDFKSLVLEAENLLQNVLSSHVSSDGHDPESIQSFSRRAVDVLSQRMDGKSLGISSGFINLDRLIGGLVPSELFILGGKTSLGKTAFAMNVASNLAFRGYNTVFFSTEMSKQQVWERFFSSLSRIPSHKFRLGMFEESDWQKLAGCIAEAEHMGRILVDDSSCPTVSECFSKLRRLLKTDRVDLVAIDYLQRMKGRGDTREQEVRGIVQGGQEHGQGV